MIDWLAKDGTRRLIAWSNTAFPREDGSVEYVIGTGIDISEQREVEKRLQRLKGKLEQQIQGKPEPPKQVPVAVQEPEGWTRCGTQRFQGAASLDQGLLSRPWRNRAPRGSMLEAASTCSGCKG